MNKTDIITNFITIMYNLNNKSMEQIKNAFINIDYISEQINENDKNKITNAILFFIENLSNSEPGFVLAILNKYIDSIIDKNYFIYYYKLRILMPEKETYTNFINEILNDKIMFPNDILKNAFIQNLYTICDTINNNELKIKVEKYIKAIK